MHNLLKTSWRIPEKTAEVSIVIPAYNAALYLAVAIESAIRQSFKDWELIVIDDGSTDGSLELIDSYVARDARIRCVRQDHQGPGAARNRGLAEARGRYLAFLDADDCLGNDDVLFKAVRAMDSLNCECLLMNARAMYNDGSVGEILPWCLRRDLIGNRKRFTPKELGDGLFYAMGPVPWAKLYRRDFLHESGLSFPHLSRSEDFPFVEMAIGLASAVGVLDLTFVCHRIATPGSLEQTKTSDPIAFANAEKWLWRRIRSYPDHARLLRAAQARAMLRLDYNLRAMLTQPCYPEVVGAARSIRCRIRVSSDGTIPGYSSIKARVDKTLRTSIGGWRAVIYRFRVCLADNGWRYTIRRIIFGNPG